MTEQDYQFTDQNYQNNNNRHLYPVMKEDHSLAGFPGVNTLSTEIPGVGTLSIGIPPTENPAIPIHSEFQNFHNYQGNFMWINLENIENEWHELDSEPVTDCSTLIADDDDDYDD